MLALQVEASVAATQQQPPSANAFGGLLLILLILLAAVGSWVSLREREGRKRGATKADS